MTYVSGFLTPVPTSNREAYERAARAGWEAFRDYGAIEFVECWGDDVPRGEHTDFYRAVKAGDDETVVFSWIVWPDKETSERCYAAMETDERFRNMEMPFDGKRMMWGGFVPIVNERSAATPS